ncbi:MAG: hypothetical protein VYC23_01600 [Chloroflexota bacterium]|nr:hypothetical protein [Chloroflexota bacterium]
MTMSGNLNSQGASGEEDEVLNGQRVRALRTPEGFFIAPQSFLPTRRDVKGDVLTIMCEENQTTGPVNSRIRWEEHVLKDNKLQVISPKNLPNLDISRSIFLIAQKMGDIEIEWASELRKTYGSSWIKRYADILDPMIGISLNFRVEPSMSYG